MLDPILSQPQNRIALVEFDSSVKLMRNCTHDADWLAADLRICNRETTILSRSGYWAAGARP
jgi:hypothetical protein